MIVEISDKETPGATVEDLHNGSKQGSGGCQLLVFEAG